MKRILFFAGVLLPALLFAQDVSLQIPLMSSTQNFGSNPKYPAMDQVNGYTASAYELSFWGINRLGNRIFKNSNWKSETFGYAAGLIFSKYGSELPVPFGVWGHEEYHRTVLAANGVNSKNGNWIFHRWDGTVYGVTDESLADLKANHLNGLLYSYVAGVQSETQLSSQLVKQDFYHPNKNSKAPLHLYNAWYVYNYFRFATSTLSDSVKVIAPKYESDKANQRDFAGADLTAWAYDMFKPDEDFYDRDNFPDGEGENRRVGFHDLPVGAQKYLIRQKKLSLLNFFNPSIVMINQIKIGDDFSFLPYFTYQPTHFGNAIGFNMPFSINEKGYYLAVNRFSSYEHSYYGVDWGWNERNLGLADGLQFSCIIRFWKQPKSFFGNEATWGGAVKFQLFYPVSDHFRVTLDYTQKSAGWSEGSAYLGQKANLSMGLQYAIRNMRL